MVRLTVSLRAASIEGAQDLLDTLRFLIPATRIEPGCCRCAAWTGGDCTVHYHEAWATEADARHRLCSSSFTSLLGVMECACQPPDVQFEFATSARGLDYVEQVRAEAEEYGGGLATSPHDALTPTAVR